jgi:hypothetical protein
MAMRIRSKFAINSTALACLVAAAGHAQEPPAPVESPASEPLEEITVTAERSLASMRLEVGRATENFWTLLNSVLDEDDFKITCRTATPTGTRLRERLCSTGFVHEELSKAASDMRSGWFYDAEPQIRRKSRIFVDKMVAAINSNPQLLAAVEELARLKAEYLAEAERRGAKD